MTFSAKKILTWSLVSVGALIVLHVFLQYLRFNGGEAYLDLIDRFNVDNEVSIPTWFSQILLFLSSLTAAITAYVLRANRYLFWCWLGLVGIILFLSIDEGASLHESFGVRAGQIFGDGISLGFIILRDWTIIALLAACIVAAIFFPFFLKLPRRTQLLFAASAFTFLSGSILWESLHFTTFGFTHTSTGFAISLSNAVEEALELIGASLLLYTIVDYLQQKSVHLKITFKE